MSYGKLAGPFEDDHGPQAAGDEILLPAGPVPAGAGPRSEQIRPAGVSGGREILPGGPQPQRGGAPGDGGVVGVAPPQGPQQAPPGVLDRLRPRAGLRHGGHENAGAVCGGDVLRPGGGQPYLSGGPVHGRLPLGILCQVGGPLPAAPGDPGAAGAAAADAAGPG